MKLWNQAGGGITVCSRPVILAGCVGGGGWENTDDDDGRPDSGGSGSAGLLWLAKASVRKGSCRRRPPGTAFFVGPRRMEFMDGGPTFDLHRTQISNILQGSVNGCGQARSSLHVTLPSLPLCDMYRYVHILYMICTYTLHMICT